MSPLMIRIVLSIAIRVLTRYRDQLTKEQKAAWKQAIKDMKTPDEIKAEEDAAKPWHERFKAEH
jgi:hypothetical protein